MPALVQFRPAAKFSRGHINEHLVTAGRGQSIMLGFGVLITGREPPISNAHQKNVSPT